MRGATSGPTSRTLDVLELLAQNPSQGMRYVDIVRHLELNQGTAHTILKTLVDRGWASRDPIDKTFTLGPALAAIGTRVDQSRPLLHAARSSAQSLARELGFSASVVELVNNQLIVSAVYPGEESGPSLEPGTKAPYSPPYGAIFATFAPDSERNAWLARSTSKNKKVLKALQRTLALASQRGYDIDWTTQPLAKMTAMAESMVDLHPSLLAAIDQILLELTTLTFDETDSERPVSSIIAPVRGARGHLNLAIAVHPLRPLPFRRIQACGQRLVQEGRKISALTVPMGVLN